MDRTAFDDDRRESYQIHTVVTSFPAGGIYFPGSNFTSLISTSNELTAALMPLLSLNFLMYESFTSNIFATWPGR